MASYGTLRSIQSLGIVYSCVARGKIILAYFACCQGNFSEVVPGVLARIPNMDERMTYTSGEYMFHYVTERGITILCITDDDFERSRAFLFLEETKSKFFDSYGDNVSRYTPYSLNSTFGEFLKQTMDVFSDDSYINMESNYTGRIRLDMINVKQLEESSQLEQLELLQSDDDMSLRSFEGHLIEDHRNKVKIFLKRHMRVVIIVLLLSIILLIVITAIVIISLVDRIETRNS